MEEKDEKKFTKKDLKLKAQEMKLQEKQRKLEEKEKIKEEKEKIKNSFGRKVKNFFMTIIIVAILLVVGFYFSKNFLTNKEIELLDEKMEQIYQAALLKIDEKEYKEAIELLKSIEEKYSKFDEATKKLKEVEQMYLNEYLVNADKYLKDKKYDKALDVLNSVEDKFKNSELILDKIADVHINKIKDEIKELEKLGYEKDYIQIFEYIVEYKENNSDKVKELKEELIAEYMDQFVLESRELMKNDYSKAKSNIDAVAKLLPDNKDIKTLKEELSKVEPSTINLTSLKSDITEGKLTISNGDNSVKNVQGNEYVNYILVPEYQSGNMKHVVEYKLDKKYTKLTGTIGVAYVGEENNANMKSPRVTIYNGDEVIYFSDKFSEDYANINFSIDVDDVDNLKIEFTGYVNTSYFIANPILTVKK